MYHISQGVPMVELWIQSLSFMLDDLQWAGIEELEE